MTPWQNTAKGNDGSPEILVFSLKMELTVGYVVLNPVCAPRVPQYFNIADMVIVYEHFHDKFINPPKDDAFFHYLDNAKSNQGQRLILPQSYIPHWPERKIHDTIFKNPSELKELVFDLVQVKRIGGGCLCGLEFYLPGIHKIDCPCE